MVPGERMQLAESLSVGVVDDAVRFARSTQGAICRGGGWRSLAKGSPPDASKQSLERARLLRSRLKGVCNRLLDEISERGLPHSELMEMVLQGDVRSLGRLGIDTEYAWLGDIVRILISGERFLEIETVGPYASHHAGPDGNVRVRFDQMPTHEQAGLYLWSVLRDVFQGLKNVRFVALLDDISELPASLAGSLEYATQICEILLEKRALRPTDVPKENFLLLLESAQQSRTEELICRLMHTDKGIVETLADGDVIFRPSEHLIKQVALHSNNRKREFKRRGILLKRNGRPTCAALDASSFIAPEHPDLVHLFMLDESFKAQQNKTYTLLRAVGLSRQDRYHNVYYRGSELPPELIALTICELMLKEVDQLLGVLSKCSDWEHFDWEEYSDRNYGRKISFEDRRIIGHVIDWLERENPIKAGPKVVAEVGGGPNFYPGMLLAPYLTDQSWLFKIEYSQQMKERLERIVEGGFSAELQNEWLKFENLMVSLGGDKYRDALARSLDASVIVAGSAYQLPEHRYDVISAYFIAESITSTTGQFHLAVRSIASALRPGGVLIAAHMVGSDGWYAGEGVHFPAVKVSLNELSEAYCDADLEFETHLIQAPAEEMVREGYHGMALVLARRPETTQGGQPVRRSTS